jgi:hypothetical protein
VTKPAPVLLPYEVVCWTPASAVMVSNYRGAPYAKLDPAPHRSHHHKKAVAVAACKTETRKLGLGAHGEVYTIQEGTRTRCVEFGCRMIHGAKGAPTLTIEDIRS